MVTVSSLWISILVSAVAVFAASSVIHMLLGYHAGDFSRAPSEDELRRAMREAGVSPGEYALPHAANSKELNSPEHVQKMTEGPVALLTVLRSGPPAMGPQLAQWLLYCLVVGIFVAYVTGRALGPGAEYLEVFRFAGTSAFLGYALALWQNPIWYGRKWSTTLKLTLDGLIYALLTAGIFGWLWPG